MRGLNAVLALLAVCSLAACVPVQRQAGTVTLAGSPEVRIVPDKVIVAENPPAPRSVTTTGDAEVRVPPDEVVITLGVETSDKDLDRAKEENDRKVRQVLSVATRYGIEAQHIQTEHISIEPRYSDSYEQKDFIGYFVRKTVVITLRDIDKFEGLLSDVLKGGVNYVHGVEFRTTELRKHRDEARALAIRAAREKAQALAAELGQQVGQPLTIQEDQGGWWSSYGAWWGSRWGSVAQNVSQNTGGGSLSPDGTVAPGQISVNARVTVQFELK